MVFEENRYSHQKGFVDITLIPLALVKMNFSLESQILNVKKINVLVLRLHFKTTITSLSSRWQPGKI